MKKHLLSLLSLLLALIFLSSCGKYDPIKPSDDELRVIGSIKDYDIYYDELRCSVMNAKSLMAKEYGIDWNNASDAEKYRAELEKRVYDGLVYNYAIQLLLGDSGYTIDNEDIQNAVQTSIQQLIDDCGGRRQYKKYLKENYLTDRVVRLNLAISYAVNELFFLLNDQGAFDEYVNFDIERINKNNGLYYSEDDFAEAYLLLLGGNILVHSEDIFIPKGTENAAEIADVMLLDAQNGKELKTLANENGFEHEQFYHFDGELDKDFFNTVKELEENEITVLELDTGWYVIKRLPPDGSYIFFNCYDLAYEYLFLKMNERIAEYEKTLVIELTDFGKSVDITKMK